MADEITPTPKPESTEPNVLQGIPLEGPDRDELPLEKVTFMTVIECLLKSPKRLAATVSGGQSLPILIIMFVIVIGSHAAYGAITGSFSGGMQWYAAPLKIVMGVLICAAICFPSLYIFSCLSGADLSLGQAAALLAAALSLVAILLIGFAPVAWVFSQSTDGVFFMGVLHLLFWGISVVFGMRVLKAGLQNLAATRMSYVRLWMIIFIVTMLQMMTTLRPLIGKSEQMFTGEKKFFLTHWAETLKKDNQRVRTYPE